MKLVDAYALAELLDIAPATIRSWANRGHIHRAGTNHRGCALYNVDQVLTYAETRGYRPTCLAA